MHPKAANEAHAAAPPNAKQLKGSEMGGVLIGCEHSGVTSTGYPFSETLHQEGTAIIKISGQDPQNGYWKIAGDVICVTYPKYGKECNSVRADGVSIGLVDKKII